ncbi:Holliday junction resolvase RuvX [Antarcticibacterium flavum]|uniref:Putative pre-16S rRNA nuclease n=1 Tax=Antarcticibacterium flavum TaxID=2058175 RepID=A0A5B7X608_9FLAO|nr:MULTISPECIES: Holliday junction resolvase RuvX [Antarcticibacterium]MCM4159352.1 Holliday junction resolvase RuvX [Antarcticibacterium sp. W02-3]QCY70944.1 Holliday junction resolvase RuvX [Antarcticibacterium flavum]
MARIVALDFGLKRTGIAVTDEMQIIASGLATVPTLDLLEFLEKYFSEENVELVLVGEPKQMDNTASQSEVSIGEFLKKFAEKFPQMPVKRVDERFTSKMAVRTMIDSGLSKKKRKDKALLDEISATIILQTYLYK